MKKFSLVLNLMLLSLPALAVTLTNPNLPDITISTDLNWKISEMLSLTIPVQEEAIPEIKRMLNKCQEDIVDYVNKKGDDYLDVFQLNMQFFPVTHTRRNKIL